MEILESSTVSCFEEYLMEIDAFTVTISFNFKTIDL